MCCTVHTSCIHTYITKPQTACHWIIHHFLSATAGGGLLPGDVGHRCHGRMPAERLGGAGEGQPAVEHHAGRPHPHTRQPRAGAGGQRSDPLHCSVLEGSLTS